MIHTLYYTTNLVNGRFYIGVHSTNDIGFGTDTWIDPYIGSGKSIGSALKKYGRKNFRVEIIAYFDTEKYAYDAERELVTEEWIISNKSKTYNIAPGGGCPPKQYGNTYASREWTDKQKEFVRQHNLATGLKPPSFNEWPIEEQTKFRILMSNRMNGENHPNWGNKFGVFQNESNPNYGGKITRNKQWINNGTVNCQINKNDLIPEGFKKGRLLKKSINGRFI